MFVNHLKDIGIVPENDKIFSYTGDFEITEMIIANSSSEVTVNTPTAFGLSAAYPNPFNPSVNIPFTIEKLRKISILIFDIGGHLVKTLTQNETISPGNYQRIWNGSNNLGQAISTGTYFIQISSNHEIFHQKITYIK